MTLVPNTNDFLVFFIAFERDKIFESAFDQ